MFLTSLALNANEEIIKNNDLVAPIVSKEKDTSFLQKYKQIYFISGLGNYNYPAWFSKNETHNQIKFQISFKYHIISGFYFGYTQKSLWDIWDIDRSSSFEDTNYNPDIFYDFENKNGVFGIKSFNLLKLGVEHESNGQSKESGDSRSWNRIYIETKFNITSWFNLGVKSWLIFDKLIQALDLVNKDLFENDDIDQYYGNFDLKLCFPFHKNFNLELLIRKGNNLDLKKGSIQIGVDFRIPISFLVKNNINPRYYIQIFNGYGETLINYNHYQLKYRFGIMLFY
jgi:phospholipase A1